MEETQYIVYKDNVEVYRTVYLCEALEMCSLDGGEVRMTLTQQNKSNFDIECVFDVE